MHRNQTLAPDGPAILPVDRIVAAFWPQIRALLAAGLRAEDVAVILIDALSGMGYADAIAPVDFKAQIEHSSASECCGASACRCA
jgi:hypothetical protein